MNRIPSITLAPSEASCDIVDVMPTVSAKGCVRLDAGSWLQPLTPH